MSSFHQDGNGQKRKKKHHYMNKLLNSDIVDAKQIYGKDSLESYKSPMLQNQPGSLY